MRRFLLALRCGLGEFLGEARTILGEDESPELRVGKAEFRGGDDGGNAGAGGRSLLNGRDEIGVNSRKSVRWSAVPVP